VERPHPELNNTQESDKSADPESDLNNEHQSR
jgi:hypothetical protein